MNKIIKKRIMKQLVISLIFALVLLSCARNENPIPIDNETQAVNEFVYNTSSMYYLWTNYIPGGIDYTSYTDSYQLFEDIKYSSLDRWSFLHDDYMEILNSFNGIEKTGGYKLKLFQYENSDNVYGIFDYVYKDGPAYNAGIVRGDYLLKINDQTLTVSNYSDLLSTDQYSVTIGELVGDQITETNTVSINHIEMNINPVLKSEVFEVSGTKIGYLLYDQFIEDYVSDLESAISSLKSQGITELILDLRYNPGGYVSTCTKLASMIAPASAINNIFLTMQWNDELTDFLVSEYGAESDYFIEKFPTPNVNLNLSRLVVLTSDRTASASEAIINGLKPYMNVQVIGKKTHGKYTGASLFYDNVEQKHNWGLYLVLNRIANVDGNTDYVDGFTPDIEVQDDYTTPLGDVNEALLARAISYLTGVTKKTKKQNLLNKPYKSYFENKIKENGLMIHIMEK